MPGVSWTSARPTGPKETGSRRGRESILDCENVLRWYLATQIQRIYLDHRGPKDHAVGHGITGAEVHHCIRSFQQPRRSVLVAEMSVSEAGRRYQAIDR